MKRTSKHQPLSEAEKRRCKFQLLLGGRCKTPEASLWTAAAALRTGHVQRNGEDYVWVAAEPESKRLILISGGKHDHLSKPA